MLYNIIKVHINKFTLIFVKDLWYYDSQYAKNLQVPNSYQIYVVFNATAKCKPCRVTCAIKLYRCLACCGYHFALVQYILSQQSTSYSSDRSHFKKYEPPSTRIYAILMIRTKAPASMTLVNFDTYAGAIKDNYNLLRSEVITIDQLFGRYKGRR